MKNTTLVDIFNNTEGRYKGDLKYYFKTLYNNASNIANPYHNMRHMLHVLWQTYDGAKYHQLDPYDTRNILIAAIFHDFNHSGNMLGNDDLEIESAIHAMKKFIHEDDTGRIKGIESLIRSTQFPYEDDEQEVQLMKKILRDADMSQTFSVAWIQQTLIGLSREININRIEFMKSQEEFISNVTFFSEWGQKKFEPKK